MKNAVFARLFAIVLSALALDTFAIRAEFSENTSCSFALFAAPVAVNDENYGTEDLDQVGDVSDNDYDPDGDPLTYSVTVSPAHGTLVMQPNGQYVYTPVQEYVGFDYATYQVCDPGGACSTAQIEFAMTFVNDLPEASNDQFYVQMNSTLNGNVILNDIDIDIEPLFCSVLSQPNNDVSFTFNLNGTFTYVPTTGFTGTDSFVYMACDPCGACDWAECFITVVNNQAPNASNDYHFTSMNTPLDLNVSQNDTDPNGDAITYSVVSGPSHGTFTLNPNGSYSYDPTDFYSGFDYITYQACDPYGACDQAILEIEVIFVNFNPVAENDYKETNEDTSLNEMVSGNDYDPNVEPLTWIMVEGPVNGSITWFSSTGEFTYTPHANWHGTEMIEYMVCDDCGACDVGILTIVILPVNDPPAAGNDAFTINEDAPLNAWVNGNDSDVEFSTLTCTLQSTAAHGALNFNPNGSFLYTPTANFFGSDSFTYQVCDNGNACATATVSITIHAVNDNPIVNDESYTISEDQMLNGNVASNDSDPETALLNYVVVNNADYGVFTLNANGTFSYTPNANYFGSDMIVYHGTDAQGASDSGTIIITINSVNDFPVVEDDFALVDEEAVLNSSVATNDFDVDGNTLTYTIITTAENGAFTLNANGSYTYAPFVNFWGYDEVVYQISDGQGGTAQATLFLTVNFINDAPILNDDTFTGNEGSLISGNVAANDIEFDDESIIYQVVSPPSLATLNLGFYGNFTCTAPTDYYGTVVIPIVGCDPCGMCAMSDLTIVINNINDAPIANDDSFILGEDQQFSGTVASNDSDIDGNDLTYTVVTPPSQGVLELNFDGTLTFTPPANQSGTFSFTYMACDDSNACDNALVTFSVTSVNDIPEMSDASFSTNEDVILSGSLTSYAYDVESANLSYVVLSGASHGTFNLNANGTFSYIPQLNYFGTDEVFVMACDAEEECAYAFVNLNVNSVNDLPIVNGENIGMLMNDSFSGNAASNDSDIEDNQLTYTITQVPASGTLNMNNNGTFTYTPPADWFGQVSAQYSACDDNEACATATINITISLTNVMPIAVNDEAFMEENNSVESTVATNDSDPDNNPLEYTLLSGAEHGIFTLYADGTYEYTPDAYWFGNDQVTYQVCDIYNACATAVVNIQVLFVNDNPVGNNDAYNVLEDGVIDANVSTNDEELDGEAMTFSLASNPSHGVVTFNPDGTFEYVPEMDYFGEDSFTYITCDPLNNCDEATVTIEVEFVNDWPVAVDDFAFTTMNQTVSGNMGVNDIEIDPEPLTFGSLNNGENGVFSMDINGNWTFIPNEGFIGFEIITYMTCDPCGTCDIGILTIEVGEVNNAPVTESASAIICSGESLVIDLNNFTYDQETVNANLNFSVNDGAGGEWFLNTNNHQLAFTPYGGFEGVATFSYNVCDDDDESLCAIGTVSVTVNPGVIPQVEETLVNNASCYGNNDGSIWLTLAEGESASFEWSNGYTESEIIYLTAGPYSVTITSNDSECPGSVALDFEITQPNPLVISGLEANSIDEDAGGSNSDFMVSGGTPPYSFTWIDANENIISEEQYLGGLTDLSQVGGYTLFVSDAHGCSVMETIIVTNVSEEVQAQVLILPNPVIDQATVVLNGWNGPANIEIYDATGRLVYSQGATGSRHNIAMSPFAPGAYTVRIANNNQVLTTQLIKQ